MTSLNEQQKKTGAAASRRGWIINPFSIYRELRMDDRTASDAVLSKKWRAAVNNNPDLFDAVIEYARVLFEATWQRDQIKPKYKPQSFPKNIQREKEIIAKEKEIITKVVEKAKNIIRMELIMPNGKKLKDCTFKECSAMGGWLKVLATKGMPGEKVGDKLTEKDLQNLK